MQTGYTHIFVLLDSSGSMESIINDTIGGFNCFLVQQKATPGKATLTQAHFSSAVHKGEKIIKTNKRFRDLYASVPYAVVDSFKDVQAVENLTIKTFVPGGGTPLLDSICIGIDDTGIELAALPEDLRPEKVLFVIITDGEENSSVAYNYNDVAERIKRQTETYDWKFTYIGANQDAIKEGGRLGISAHNSLNYAASAEGVSATFSNLGKKVSNFRSLNKGSALYSCSMDYTVAERNESMGGNVIANSVVDLTQYDVSNTTFVTPNNVKI